MKQEKGKLSGKKKIVFFTILMLISFSVVVSFGYERKEINDAIIWKVCYVDSKLKLQDYIYSTSENGCNCGKQPYEFNTAYLELPRIYKDSSSAIERFYKLYSESNLVFEVYPYCLVEDWGKPHKKEDGILLTVRSEYIDTWIVCQKLGLIDSTGHYID